MNYYLILLLSLLFLQCNSSDDPTEPDQNLPSDVYFPPINSDDWETINVADLDWNENELANALDYLETQNTRAFLILHKGRIVVEEYWGKDIAGINDFDRSKKWYWASAGKTLSTFLTGLAQEQGHLSIDDKTSDHLGTGWTSAPIEKENLITIKHQLTMTTGLDYDVQNLNCTAKECLKYGRDAGSQWYYHNAPYTLLKDVIESATGKTYNGYTNEQLEQTIGFKGEWIQNNDNNLYWSTARDMARFGLLISNNGKWEDDQIMKDEGFFNEMINTSQELNPAYGYLWWLNGKSSFISPGLPNSFNGELSSNAPEDLFAGMGKNGQLVEIIPSMDLVVVRMGDNPDNGLVPITFHDEMWGELNKIWGN